MIDEISFYEIPNFFKDFDKVREHFDQTTYEDITNPVDGTVYPGICRDIPEEMSAEVVDKINSILETKQVAGGLMFARLSVEGVKAPHQAHTDLTMGPYACMVYLNRPEDCKGGTSFIQHKETGMWHHPLEDSLVEVWQRDTKNYDAWEIIKQADVETNKAVLFESALMHRAEPVEGFGKGAKDGRLVLSFFFELEDKDEN